MVIAEGIPILTDDSTNYNYQQKCPVFNTSCLICIPFSFLPLLIKVPSAQATKMGNISYQGVPKIILLLLALKGGRWRGGTEISYLLHLFSGRPTDDLALMNVSHVRERLVYIA